MPVRGGYANLNDLANRFWRGPKEGQSCFLSSIAISRTGILC
jgi:hypothetical protein